jgi:hypothetical protein
LDETVVDHLAKTGYDPKMGARPLGRKIDQLIRIPLSKRILFDRLVDCTVTAVMKEDKIEFEVINCQFKQMDKDIIIIGKLRSQLKAAPLMPLFHAEQEIEIKPMSLGENTDEKLVVVTSAPVEPKKKRLKRKAVEISNEPPQIGND